MHASVSALKEAVELMTGQRGGGAALAITASSGVVSGSIVTSPSNLVVYDRTSSFTIDPVMNFGVINVNSASPVVITVPNSLPAGWNALFLQVGAGQFTITAAVGTTLKNKYGWFASESIDCGISLLVRSNAGGAAAVVWVSGDVST